MGATTEISWTDSTFNPWWGCTNVSAECDHCYAETGANRYGFKIWGQDADRRHFKPAHFDEPLRWGDIIENGVSRSRRVFCGSYCDLMEDRADLSEDRKQLISCISKTDWLTWLLLTKRPQNFRRFLPTEWIESPLRNVWLMTSVGVSKSLWRADALAETPAVVRGLSIEPLLEDISEIGNHLAGISWCIVGGESGPRARLMNPDWARRIRDACAHGGIAFFMKQMGGVRDKRGKISDLPEDLRIREFPKVSA